MAGKAGLKTELETIESHWRDSGLYFPARPTTRQAAAPAAVGIR
ncbi:hypothetical protein ABZ845_10565 [Streptomyces sp. NPDC047022]